MALLFLNRLLLHTPAMFASYEVTKFGVSAFIRDKFGLKNSEDVSPMTLAGFTAICAGGTVAALVQFSAGHVFEAFSVHLRGPREARSSISTLLRSAKPPVMLCLPTIPAQIIGFLAFEYGKTVLDRLT